MTHRPRSVAVLTDVLRGPILALAEAALATPAAALAASAPPLPPTLPGVALVSVMGPLAQRAESDWFGEVDGYDAILERFAAAMASPDVGSVVLVIDSPGGDVAGLFELHRRMVELRDGAGKPVYAYADELAASAAYAIATVADGGIFLPATGSVGSIGVIAIHREVSRALDEAGVTVNVIRAPERKAESTAFEPLTDPARAKIQAEVDRLAELFATTVAEARGLAPDKIAATKGQTFMGKDAVRRGLADGVATLEQVVTAAQRAAAKGSTMKISKALAAAIGVSEQASADEVERALDASAPLIEAGRAALQRTGETSLAAVVGTIDAWRTDAAATKDLRAQVARMTTAVESQERVAALEDGVKSRKLTPGAAWKNGDKAQGPDDHFLAQSPAQIRTLVAKLAPYAGGPAPQPNPIEVDVVAGSITPEEERIAAAWGMSPKKYAKARVKYGAFNAPAPTRDDAADAAEET